jgi:DNA-binding IscR family transcriptional regulator
LAPFGDAEQLRTLIDRDVPHRALYQVFLDVRDAAAKILEHTTLAQLIKGPAPQSGKGKTNRAKKKDSGSVLPMVVGGHKGE